VDQGGKAGGEDDAALLPSVSLEPSAAGAEPVGVQPGQSVAATGPAQANRELVADEFAATFGEDRRTAGQARPVLLAAAGGRPSEPAAVRSDAGPDRAAAGVADAGQVRIGIVLRRMELGVSGGVVKAGQNRGQFAPSGCRSQIKSVHFR
jgi:hypothetical protein